MAVGIDTTNPNALPQGLNPGYVFGYIDGHWQTYNALKAKYPLAVPVSITVFGSLEAQCCDCENGDLTPQQAGNWARGKVAQGVVPLVYCSWAVWNAVKTQVGNIPCDYWIAAYPGPGPVLYPGSVAHQWIDRGTYDQSVVQDGWIPGRSTSPPIPVPTLKEYNMNAPDPSSDGTWIVDPDGHVETLFGAPYLGGLNNPPNSFNWQQVGTITGITPWMGPNGKWGYAIIIKHFQPFDNGAWYSAYTYPRP